MSSAAPRILRGVEAFRSRSFLAMPCSIGRRFESGRAARGTLFRLRILCRESPVQITRRGFFNFEPTEGAQRFFLNPWRMLKESCMVSTAKNRYWTGSDPFFSCEEDAWSRNLWLSAEND